MLHRLGLETTDYFRDRLEKGLTLAKSLLNAKDFDMGSVYAVAPESISKDKLKDLYSGGLLPTSSQPRLPIIEDGRKLVIEQVPNTDHELAALVNTYLSDASQHVCLFEDEVARSTDPALSTTDKRVTFGQELYYLLGHNDDVGKALSIIKKAKSWLFIGIMTSLQGINRPPDVTELTEQELLLFSRNATAIIVGAYDGESFVIWEESAGASGAEFSIS